jgi:hypothetical protein
MIFIFYLFYNIAWSGLLVGYPCEILPYSIRAKGLTVLFLSVDIALIFNQYVNPVALESIHWKYYIVFVSYFRPYLKSSILIILQCVWLAVEVFVVWKFYIETKNTPLEEIARHFDGDQALVGDTKGQFVDHNMELRRVNQKPEKDTIEIVSDERLEDGKQK